MIATPIYTKRFFQSDYFPGGEWRVFKDAVFVDSFRAEWEADKFIAKVSA